mmetsp:Transcript_22078/g.36077  ORF Transcript_22078/g.36077 Transcript_22078/m.36077 type:complete len:340 (+) Transcript_22078:22-1041(+)
MNQQHCLQSSAAMKKSSPPWWDLFSRCRGEEEEEAPSEDDDDDHYNDMSPSTAAEDCSGGGCVGTAIDGAIAILRVLMSSSDRSSPDEEDQAEEVKVTTHHMDMEPTSPCYVYNSCLDDKTTESDPVDDTITVVATTELRYEDIVPDIDDEEALKTNDARSVEEDVNTALSWFVLSGILGSPAPSSVVKRGRKSDITMVWDLDVKGNIRGEHDEIPDIPEDSIDAFEFNDKEGADRLNDSCTTASLSSEDDYESGGDFYTVPEIDDIEQQVSNEFSPQELMASHSVKEIADSALAWGALAIILNAPAPSALATNNTTITKHLFGDDEVAVELDDLVLPL